MQNVLSEGESQVASRKQKLEAFMVNCQNTSQKKMVWTSTAHVEGKHFYAKFSICNLYYCFLKVSPNYVLGLTIPVFAPACTDSNSNVEMSNCLKLRVYVWAGGNCCVSFGRL